MNKTSNTRINRGLCKKEHEGSVPGERIAALGESQAGAWRHRCAACAYTMGYADALRANKRPRTPIEIVGPCVAALGKLHAS